MSSSKKALYNNELLKHLIPACRSDFKEYRPHEFIENDGSNCILPNEFIRLCPWEARYIAAVATSARNGIVEIGRYYGGSTLVLAAAAQNIRDTAHQNVIVHSFDIEPQDDDTLAGFIDELGYNNVNLYLHDSTDPEPSRFIDYDILFIDGDHTYEGVYKDLEAWYDNLQVGGHVLLHDCYVGYYIQEAIMDFTLNKKVQFLQTPYKSMQYWSYETGSICHFRKLGD